jgi:hypothetical protein
MSGMAHGIQELFQKLKEGEVKVPKTAIDQIVQALRNNGFESVADDLARSSVV